MSISDSNQAEFGWPWTLRWPTAGGGSPAFAFAPERLWQPINPGWSFGNITVNNTNSRAPEVEQALVGRYSYGRQIGRIMEALEVLVAKAPPAVRGDPRVEDFVVLAKEVAQAKAEARDGRLDRLRRELDALKQHDRAAWERLVKD